MRSSRPCSTSNGARTLERVLGAGGWQILREITLPLLAPSLVFLFIKFVFEYAKK